MARVANELAIDDSNHFAYWPGTSIESVVWHADLHRFVRLLTGYLENYDSLTDEAARKMLDEYLSIDRARNGVKSTFVPRFGKVIPAKQVTRFFQIDNKLDAVINAELAKLVPLAR